MLQWLLPLVNPFARILMDANIRMQVKPFHFWKGFSQVLHLVIWQWISTKMFGIPLRGKLKLSTSTELWGAHLRKIFFYVAFDSELPSLWEWWANAFCTFFSLHPSAVQGSRPAPHWDAPLLGQQEPAVSGPWLLEKKLILWMWGMGGKEGRQGPYLQRYHLIKNI